jgi:hypothetical protein
MHNDSSPPTPRAKILATFEQHGCYVRAWGDHYFLAASELNHHLEPGTTWDDPQAQVRAATALIAEVETDPRATTSGGSSRFTDRDEYRRHRRSLRRAIGIFRRAWKLNQMVEAAADG